MGPVEIAVVAAVVLVGALLQGTVGFGLNLVAAPVLVLLEPRLVPGPLLLCALVLTLAMTWRERRAADLSGLGWAMVGRLPGTAAGAGAVALLPARGLALALGGTVLAGVAMSAAGRRFPPSRPTLVTAGAVSGLMGTATSIGGPPMALVYQDSPGATLRATLSAFFVVGSVVSLAALAVVGRFGAWEATAGLLLMPPLLAGFAVSARTGAAVDRGRTRVAVLAVSALAGLTVVLANLP